MPKSFWFLIVFFTLLLAGFMFFLQGPSEPPGGSSGIAFPDKRGSKKIPALSPPTILAPAAQNSQSSLQYLRTGDILGAKSTPSSRTAATASGSAPVAARQKARSNVSPAAKKKISTRKRKPRKTLKPISQM
ncbi:MAG: hypothetical protein HY551_07850 [Elusimicrobia bacterium]|nr:hypothetical protein [Elusimicrobiota bacterium]